MVLITGGAGYIGSHTVAALAEHYGAGGKRDAVIAIVDNHSNSKPEVIYKLRTLCAPYGVQIKHYTSDARDEDSLHRIFLENDIDAVIHFAGLKAVGESVSLPLEYYSHNINATLSLVRVMLAHNCRKLVFSSSATVYGVNPVPYFEKIITTSSSPYGWSKVMQERILTDICYAEAERGGFSAVLLRYFNPIGAHESGLLGDDPNGRPNNLMPYICRVAVGKLDALPIYGDDYPTPDGTCIRDYIHVDDLARGHVKALDYIKTAPSEAVPINLGTGHGYSVKEVVGAFERACGFDINKYITARRDGDIPKMEASVERAKNLLDWHAEYGIDKMCLDSWKYIKNN